MTDHIWLSQYEPRVPRNIDYPDWTIVRLLHELGADVNIVSNNGFTALHDAALNGHIAVVRLLHELGAHMNIADNDGLTALQIAVTKGHQDVIQFLENAGLGNGSA